MLVYQKVNITDLVLDLLLEAMWPCGGLMLPFSDSIFIDLGCT